MAIECVDPIVCVSCGARFRLEQLSEEEYQALIDHHYWREFSEELRMLERVSDFYRRHPEAEGRIKPHFAHVLDSDDPRVIDELFAGVPFAQIEVPAEQSSLPPEVIEADMEVIEYLRHNGFALGRRLTFVRERVSRIQGNLEVVACPSCRSGWLRLVPQYWVNPHEIY